MLSHSPLSGGTLGLNETTQETLFGQRQAGKPDLQEFPSVNPSGSMENALVKTKECSLLSGLILLAGLLCLAPTASAEAKTSWWPAEVEQVLVQAGANRSELVKA